MARKSRPARARRPRATPTLDVALAFASFVHATGDLDYLRRTAWPVIHAVAEWVESRAERTRRGFEIREITGPAEADPPRNNNAFVNMAAARCYARRSLSPRTLGEEPRRLWRDIAERPGPARGVARSAHPELRRLPDRPTEGGHAGSRRRHLPGGLRRTDRRRDRHVQVRRSQNRHPGTSEPRCSRRSCPTTRRSAGLPGDAAELLETGYGNFINEPFLEIDEFTEVGPRAAAHGPDVREPRRLPDHPAVRLPRATPWAGRGRDLGRAVRRHAGGLEGDPCRATVDARGGAQPLAEVGRPSAAIDGRRLARAS